MYVHLTLGMYVLHLVCYVCNRYVWSVMCVLVIMRTAWQAENSLTGFRRKAISLREVCHLSVYYMLCVVLYVCVAVCIMLCL